MINYTDGKYIDSFGYNWGKYNMLFAFDGNKSIKVNLLPPESCAIKWYGSSLCGDTALPILDGLFTNKKVLLNPELLEWFRLVRVFYPMKRIQLFKKYKDDNDEKSSSNMHTFYPNDMDDEIFIKMHNILKQS